MAQTHRSPRVARATFVELVTVAKGRHTTVRLRNVRSHRVLFECSTTDSRGAELAVLTVERYCVERGLVLVMPANDTARAAQPSHAA
jgi:GTPase